MLRQTIAAAAAALSLFAANAHADAVGGTKVNDSRVEAHATDVYHISFYAGELATVVVTGDGDTDLDLYIYDQFGNLVASDTDTTDVCIGQFVPTLTGSFRIELKNLGGVYNRYQIAAD